MAKEGKLYSARDAINTRAFLELMSSIDAIPIRTLKPSKDKGGLYLVNFHKSTSVCLLTRLPSNLIRALISYNTITELLALSLSCRQFSKFLFDKYIQFSGELENLGLYRAPTFKFQDHFDLHRLEDLKNSGKIVKIYGSIQPEFTSIFHVSARGDLFYSYYQGAILEGTFQPNADTLTIKSSRPCIPNVTLTDVSGEAIACASATELALSLPTSLRQVTMASSEPPVAVYFLANKRMILVQKERCFELYHTTLALAQVLPHEGWVTKLYLPDPAKAVFATLSVSVITSYAVVAGGTLQRKFRHERKLGDSIVDDILVHRETLEEEHYDFLICLQRDGVLLVNFKPVTSQTGWQQIYLCEGHLIALKPDSLQVFSFSPDSKTYVPVHNLSADLLSLPSFPALLNCSRMKIASVYQQTTGLSIAYYQPFADRLKFHCEVQLPVEEAKVTFHRQMTMIKGVLLKWNPKPVKKKREPVEEEKAGLLETVPCVYIVNFNADSMIGGAPNLVSQAMTMIEDRDRENMRLEQKRLERKQQKRAEKARKHEDLDSKHKPKY